MFRFELHPPLLSLAKSRTRSSSVSNPTNCTGLNEDENFNLRIKQNTGNEIVNKFKCRALEIAYNTFNRKQIKEKKKKHR